MYNVLGVVLHIRCTRVQPCLYFTLVTLNMVVFVCQNHPGKRSD